MKNEKVLLIIGFGYIGRSVVNSYREKELYKKIIVLSRSVDITMYKAPSIIVYKGSCADTYLLEYILIREAVTDIIYTASTTTEVRDAYKYQVQTMIESPGLVIPLLETIRKNNLSDICMIALSTTQLYDSVYDKLSLDGEPVYTESVKIEPNNIKNPYTQSKLNFETNIIYYVTQCSIRCSIIRLSNVYGGNDTHGRLIPRTVQSIRRGSSPTIYVNEYGISPMINLVHISDVISAFDIVFQLMHDNRNAGGQFVFNVASNTSYPIADIVNKLCDYHNSGIHPLLEVKKNIFIGSGKISIDKLATWGYSPSAFDEHLPELFSSIVA